MLQLSVKAVQGEQVRLGLFSDLKPDCTPWAAPGVKITGAPQHGSTSVRTATSPVKTNEKCGIRTAPVSALFYVSAPSYTGEDKVAFEIIAKDDAPRPVTVTISVEPKAARPAR